MIGIRIGRALKRTRAVRAGCALFVGVLLGVWQAAHAVHVRMELEPDALQMGESAELSVVIQTTDEPAEPEIPDVPGLRIGSPSVQFSFSRTTIDGVSEQRRFTTYRYTVIPLQPGEYEIGPLTYTQNDETFEIPAKTLQVVATRDGDDPDAQAEELSDFVFAELEVNKERVYVQEPFTLTIAIYSRDINVGRDVSLVNLPDTGIATEPFQELRPTREIVDNHVFNVRRYRTRIRPLTAGTIRFAPELRIQILVPRERGRRPFDDPFFDGVFSNYEAHPFELPLTPVEVTARAIPQTDRPESYTGSVGSFDFSVRVHPTEVQAGDPITVSMLIEGEGNMTAVSAPGVPENDLFRVYPPRLINQDLDRAASRGRKMYEQVIIPRSDEATEVPALHFSFFDPAEERFETRVEGPFELAIQKRDPTDERVVRADDARTDHQTRIVGEDIVYLKSAPARWMNVYDGPWYLRPGFLALQTAPPILVLAVFLLARRRRRLDTDIALARRYRAPRSARPGLRRAEKALQDGAVDAFHDGLWSALSAYFGDRLNLAPGSVTAEEVQRVMAQRGLDEETLKSIGYLFADCEQLRYAGGRVDHERMRALLDDFRRVLKACERVKA